PGGRDLKLAAWGTPPPGCRPLFELDGRPRDETVVLRIAAPHVPAVERRIGDVEADHRAVDGRDIDPAVRDDRLRDDRMPDVVRPQGVAGVDVEAEQLAVARREHDLRAGDYDGAGRPLTRALRVAPRPERLAAGRVGGRDDAAHRVVARAVDDDRPRAFERPHLLPVVEVRRDVGEIARLRLAVRAEHFAVGVGDDDLLLDAL